MATRWRNAGQWSVRGLAVGGGRGRRAAVAEPVVPPEFLQSDAVRVAEAFEVGPAPAARRGAFESPPELEVDLAPGEAALVAMRHPSGALTFHQPLVPPAARRRGAAGAAGASRAVFQLPLGASAAEGGRRGLVGKAVKVVVLKVAGGVADKAAGWALSKLAAAAEKAIWKKR